MGRKLNAEMQNKGIKGLPPFIPHTFHIVLTAFYKGV